MATETLARAPATTRWSRSPFAPAVAIYVALRVLTLVMVLLTDLSNHHGLVHSLSVWDGKWFLLAANHGWPSHLPLRHGHIASSTVAFFPLFPLLMRGLAHLTGLSSAVVGLWVSGITGLVAVVAMGALTRFYAGEDAARRAAVLFALSPGSFVFSLIYNEGIVITLCVVAIWALMRRRWLLAGVVGAVATATSPVALILVLVALWSAGRAIARERAWRALVAPVLTPVGFLAWTGYLWAHTGTLRAWQQTERGGWQSYPSLRYALHIVVKFVTNPVSPTMTGQILIAGTVVCGAGLLLVYRERMPSELVVYATGAVALFAVSAPVGLRPRFVMLAFPLTMAAATRFRGRGYLAIAVGSAIALALMTIETIYSFAVFP
ncbi:MAG: mannosyltransferase family protein [Acidimicrobiales bacterium]